MKLVLASVNNFFLVSVSNYYPVPAPTPAKNSCWLRLRFHQLRFFLLRSGKEVEGSEPKSSTGNQLRLQENFEISFGLGSSKLFFLGSNCKEFFRALLQKIIFSDSDFSQKQLALGLRAPSPARGPLLNVLNSLREFSEA